MMPDPTSMSIPPPLTAAVAPPTDTPSIDIGEPAVEAYTAPPKRAAEAVTSLLASVRPPEVAAKNPPRPDAEQPEARVLITVTAENEAAMAASGR